MPYDNNDKLLTGVAAGVAAGGVAARVRSNRLANRASQSPVARVRRDPPAQKKIHNRGQEHKSSKWATERLNDNPDEFRKQVKKRRLAAKAAKASSPHGAAAKNAYKAEQSFRDAKADASSRIGRADRAPRNVHGEAANKAYKAERAMRDAKQQVSAKRIRADEAAFDAKNEVANRRYKADRAMLDAKNQVANKEFKADRALREAKREAAAINKKARQVILDRKGSLANRASKMVKGVTKKMGVVGATAGMADTVGAANRAESEGGPFEARFGKFAEEWLGLPGGATQRPLTKKEKDRLNST